MKEAQAIAAAQVGQQRAGNIVFDHIALTKPRLNFLVVASSAAGYYLGAGPGIEAVTMARAVAAIALVAGGAAALNQVYERRTDAMMRRTRQRPLPDGRIGPTDAVVFGLALALLGVMELAINANLLSATLAVATLVIYLLVYTPMKLRTPLATVVGAVPGALPPLIGWTAARGAIDAGGLALFAIVFLWQIPHFMAIAWMYRDDYAKAGFPMLPVIEPDGRRAGRQALMYSIALLPVSLMPTWAGVSGSIALTVGGALGVALVFLSARFASERTDRSARALFYWSITYLPLLWIALVVDKTSR
jgi:protoheme IX farnesyltransferase